MAKLKLTKTLIDSTKAEAKDIELRDTIVPGFLCKVTPAGSKVFMVQYRTNAGLKRKPSIGRFGELSVEQARMIASDLMAEVRRGKDPSAQKAADRTAPTVVELCARFITDYSMMRNKPASVASYQRQINMKVIPHMGQVKIKDVTREHIVDFMKKNMHAPIQANRVMSCLSKMFNMAEVWGYRPDGSNPCRHVPKNAERGKTRLITDDQVIKIYQYLDRAQAEALEHPSLLLAIRLQFAFAARMSEITQLEWSWVDLKSRRVTWPDSKTGDMSKPISSEAFDLLTEAWERRCSSYVCYQPDNINLPMGKGVYYVGWQRVLKAAGVPPIGTHGIRHRAATDIANSGVPVKVGMALTAHKTVTMFMRYVHIEDDPVREAADLVARRRRDMTKTVSEPY